MNKYICLITFIIYYLIATFIYGNLLFNPNLKITLINKKTKEQKEPSILFLIVYCWLWIIFIPTSNWQGEEQ